MNNPLTTTTDDKKSNIFLKELREVNKNLKRLLLIIPEESIRGYENSEKIKDALTRALKTQAPR